MRPSSYGMNVYVAWNTAPWSGMPLESRYHVFRRTAVGGSAANISLFAEIHPDSLCRPMFGMDMNSPNVYNFPGNYHGPTSTFSCLEGHTERRPWRDSWFNNPLPPPANWHNHTGNPARASRLPDLNSLKERTTLRL
jgi:hypothetical protein